MTLSIIIFHSPLASLLDSSDLTLGLLLCPWSYRWARQKCRVCGGGVAQQVAPLVVSQMHMNKRSFFWV